MSLIEFPIFLNRLVVRLIQKDCVPAFTAINSEPQTPAQNIDYNFAREELMLNELSNDPIQRAIARLEKQHEEDKQVYLGTDDGFFHVCQKFTKVLPMLKRGHGSGVRVNEVVK